MILEILNQDENAFFWGFTIKMRLPEWIVKEDVFTCSKIPENCLFWKK